MDHDGEKNYLEGLLNELKRPEAITDPHKEKKIADTLAKLVSIPDVCDLANQWCDLRVPLLFCGNWLNFAARACNISLALFVRDKLRSVMLMDDIVGQLYEDFAIMSPEERKLPLSAIKTVVTTANMDNCTTRELEIACRLVEALVPRILGGITEVASLCSHARAHARLG